jgi:hypothetical protein
MSAFKANGTQALAAREAAVVAALRVINSLMRLDGRFLADTARTMGMERYVHVCAYEGSIFVCVCVCVCACVCVCVCEMHSSCDMICA